MSFVQRTQIGYCGDKVREIVPVAVEKFVVVRAGPGRRELLTVAEQADCDRLVDGRLTGRVRNTKPPDQRDGVVNQCPG